MIYRGFLVTLALAGVCGTAGADDWPQFRGQHGDGISGEAGAPLTWSASENIKWKTPLPGPGNSSPVVLGDRVFLTCATDGGKSRGLYCFARDDGRELWSQVIAFDGDEPTHETNPPCASSPAASGSRVVVWHGCAGLFCYDLGGMELWSRDLGQFRHIWGYAASPRIHGDRVYLNCGPGARSFVTAIDLNNGETLWHVDYPGDDDELADNNAMWTGSWSTPIILEAETGPQVIVSLPQEVKAFNAQDGEVIWNCSGLGPLAYTSCLVGDGVCVAMGGYGGPALGLRLGGQGDVTATHRLWVTTDPNPQRIGSGAILGDHIYMANEPGIMQCLNLQTGAEVWQGRLPGGNIWGSILAVGNRLYVTNQDGTTHVIAARPDQLEILASNPLGEASNATPAISNGQLFLRTDGALWCVEDP